MAYNSNSNNKQMFCKKRMNTHILPWKMTNLKILLGEIEQITN